MLAPLGLVHLSQAQGKTLPDFAGAVMSLAVDNDGHVIVRRFTATDGTEWSVRRETGVTVVSASPGRLLPIPPPAGYLFASPGVAARFTPQEYRLLSADDFPSAGPDTLQRVRDASRVSDRSPASHPSEGEQ